MLHSHRQLTLPLSWKLSYRPEEYVVSDCNRYAFDWLEKWPFKIHENFACLVGDSGAGKSHLAGIWAKRLNAEFISISSSFSFDRWLDISSTTTKLQRYFILDDADTINDDILLFCIYNTIKESNSFLLLTAKNPPIRWNLQLADVRSRMLTINVVHIQKPDESAITGIVKQMLKQRGLEASDQSINYISSVVERSYSSINFWVDMIDKSIRKKPKLTTSFVKSIIDAKQN